MHATGVLLINDVEVGLTYYFVIELDEAREQYLEEQKELYQEDLYDIDWEEVRRGQCAGMPGKWVCGCGVLFTQSHLLYWSSNVLKLTTLSLHNCQLASIYSAGL